MLACSDKAKRPVCMAALHCTALEMVALSLTIAPFFCDPEKHGTGRQGEMAEPLTLKVYRGNQEGIKCLSCAL